MIDVRALGYVVVEATRVDAWRSYARDVLGMQVLDAPDGALYLKMDEPIGDGGTPPALHHVFEPRKRRRAAKKGDGIVTPSRLPQRPARQGGHAGACVRRIEKSLTDRPVPRSVRDRSLQEVRLLIIGRTAHCAAVVGLSLFDSFCARCGRCSQSY